MQKIRPMLLAIAIVMWVAGAVIIATQPAHATSFCCSCVCSTDHCLTYCSGDYDPKAQCYWNDPIPPGGCSSANLTTCAEFCVRN